MLRDDDSMVNRNGTRQAVPGRPPQLGVPLQNPVQLPVISNQNNYPDLSLLACIRQQIAKIKSENPLLIRRELYAHCKSIQEYSEEYFQELIEKDAKVDKLRRLAKFKLQPYINSGMRYLIFDFILYAHTRLNLSTSTLFLTFDIIDNYTSKYILKNNHYQLLALTALWLSSKFWDTKSRVIKVKTLTELCCNQYTAKNFKDMEIHLLKALEWSLSEGATFDSLVDMLLFLRGNKPLLASVCGEDYSVLTYVVDETLNINDIKLGAIILCELVSFDLGLLSAYDNVTLSVAAITLMALAIKNEFFNKWENLNDVCSDAKLVSAMNNILLLVVDKDDRFPSSIRFKYLGGDGLANGQNTAKRLIDCLRSYNTRLQADELYRMQDLCSIRDLYPSAFDSIDGIIGKEGASALPSYSSSAPTTAFSTPDVRQVITPMSSSASSPDPSLNLPGQAQKGSVHIAGIAPKSLYAPIYRQLQCPVTPTTPPKSGVRKSRRHSDLSLRYLLSASDVKAAGSAVRVSDTAPVQRKKRSAASAGITHFEGDLSSKRPR